MRSESNMVDPSIKSWRAIELSESRRDEGGRGRGKEEG